MYNFANGAKRSINLIFFFVFSMHFFEINKNSWNQRVSVHLESDFYAVEDFKKGKEVLNSIERSLLGELKGKSLLHLQCHFGQDTLALARHGAIVTGIDFSEKAISEALSLAKEIQIPARFICSNVYDVPNQLRETFDIVFTTYGVLGWLPDMDAWAEVVKKMLCPGGKLVLVEFHPILWMFDDSFKQLTYSYFKGNPIIEEKNTTYTDDRKIKMETFQEITWNHSLHEVISALIRCGLKLSHFSEYPYSPYPCFPDMVEMNPGEFHLKGMTNIIPMVYALTAENEK